MRFVLAIAAFVVAAVMIALGIAQRTVLLEPSSISLTVKTADAAPYTVIGAGALGAHPGAQTVEVSGAPASFIALGRSTDVRAWIGDDAFSTVRYDKASSALTTAAPNAPTSTPAPATPGPTATSTPTPSAPPGTEAPATPATPAAAAPAANPAGSDLWLEEFSGEQSTTATVNVPEGYSLLVASDGTNPAPANIRITWPLDNSTPWAGPLIVGGLGMLLVGLIFYLWAIWHMRRSRGPRRNMPKGPRLPRLPRTPRPKTIKEVTPGGARRAIGRSPRSVAVPVVLVGALALSGCSAEYWPNAGEASSPPPTIAATPVATADAAAASQSSPPAVTVPQLERIIGKIAAQTKETDASLDATTLATRFAGPALALREANYKVRAGLPEFPAPDPIPAGPIALTVPQQTESWPRVVMTVLQNKDDPTTKPTALVLMQESPRANYVVRYAVNLVADAVIPGMAPARIGSPIVSPDAAFTLLPPGQVTTAYADIMFKGADSQFAQHFDTANDPLLKAVGVEAKNQRRAAIPPTAAIEFANTIGNGRTIALATNDSGAIVTANINETETVKPTDGGTVSPQNAAKAYSGVENSAKGITQTFGDQMLFFVPPAGSTGKITLLGFAQGLTSASEVP